ncbi:PCC domain-containing protein [Methylobacterium sp. JK268]
MRPDPVRSFLAQPGPVRAERRTAAAGALRHRAFALARGTTLLDALAGPLAAAGMAGATVHLDGGSFSPFAYVMPALSRDPAHAAYYSETFRPPGETRLERASATFGHRDGVPFLHVHGTWIEADGRRRAGHLLPAEVVVATPPRAEAWGCAEAAWSVLPDAETNFALFTPVPGAVEAAERGCILLKIQPNEELFAAIEATCAALGMRRARVRGLGSIVRPAFADGRVVPTDASEVLIREGSVAAGPDGSPVADLDIAVVDVDGAIHEGVLARGRNTVCITFELGLEAL